MNPQMLPTEIALMKRILSSYGQHIDVLEWGSGGSTVYFTEFLRNQKISYTWTSIEYNNVWYEKVKDSVAGDLNTKVVLFDVGNTNLKQREAPMDKYVSYPRTLGKKYNVIFVDGRKRRRCLLEASLLLKPKGTVVLHDGRRTYYHCAFSAFPDSRVLLPSGLWRGRVEYPGVISKLVNFVIYWAFRVYTFSFRFLPKTS